MSKLNTKTPAQRSAKHKKKREKNGYVRRSYWIKSSKEKDAKKIIENLNNED